MSAGELLTSLRLQVLYISRVLPRFVSKVLSQLNLGELGELSHVLHTESLCDGHPQLPSQIATAWAKTHSTYHVSGP